MPSTLWPVAMKRIAGDDESCGEKPAGVHDHQSLRDRVHRQRDDHRRDAKERHAGAADQPQRDAAADAHRNRQRLAERPPAGGRRRHHPADGNDPRHRQVDLAEQDDDHHAGRDDAEERCDLKLLQQVLRRQEAARIEAADKQHQHDAAERPRDGRVDAPADAADHVAEHAAGTVRGSARLSHTGRAGCGCAAAGPSRGKRPRAARCPGTAAATTARR